MRKIPWKNLWLKFIHGKKRAEDKQLYMFIYYSQMKMWNEASAGILQCKWVFDRKVRDMMQFKWIKEKKMWKKQHTIVRVSGKKKLKWKNWELNHGKRQREKFSFSPKVRNILLFFIFFLVRSLRKSFAPIENLYLHNFILDIMIKHRLIIIYIKHYGH